MIVQIYAITSVAEALTLAGLGVDHVGFVAGDYGQVYGELSFDQARAITLALTGKAYSSALTMSTDVAEILRMAAVVRPDIVHVSTDTEAVGVAAMAELRRSLPAEIALMKAVSVTGPASVETALKFAATADILLLDTKVEGMPGVGATGVTHDWAISRQIINRVSSAYQGRVKVILAGGLTPTNVTAAIAAAQPWGVDSNTGTNVPGDPLVKDVAKVREFVGRAKGK